MLGPLTLVLSGCVGTFFLPVLFSLLLYIFRIYEALSLPALLSDLVMTREAWLLR